MNQVGPAVSVLIPTRGRGDSVVRTVRSVLASDYPNLELMVIDQSEDEATEKALAPYLSEQRLCYIRSGTRGKSVALNLGLLHCRGDYVLFTDDDCEVPPAWVDRALAVFEAEPRAGVIMGALEPAPHDPRADFVPAFIPQRFRRLSSRLVRGPELGVGANMAVRREVLRCLQGFDEALGPGSELPGAEDWDLGYRALRAGYTVIQDPISVVVHWGLRDYSSGSARRLIMNNYYGIGASYVRQAWHRDPMGLVLLGLEAGRIVGEIALQAARRRRPLGLRRLGSLLCGALAATLKRSPRTGKVSSG